MKKNYQNIKFRAVDLKKGLIEIQNDFSFTNLNEFEFEWTIWNNEGVVKKGVFTINLAPAEKVIHQIDFQEIEVVRTLEWFLDFSVKNLVAKPFLSEGFEVAKAQFLLQYRTRGILSRKMPLELTIEKSDQQILIKNEVVQWRLDKKTGLLTSFIFKNKELLVSPPIPHFWRPPNDNDFGNGMPERCAIWRKAGQNLTLKSITLLRNDGFGDWKSIKAHYYLASVAANFYIEYQFSGFGIVVLKCCFKPTRKDLPELPRIGLYWQIPEELENIHYFGRGKHENYADRKESAHVGMYKSSVTEQYHPYIAPQETGYKTEVRWATLTNQEGVGIQISGTPTFGMSALFYSPEALTREARGSLHTYDLQRETAISLCIDQHQMGVGGINSWGAMPLDKYRLAVRRYDFQITIGGVR